MKRFSICHLTLSFVIARGTDDGGPATAPKDGGLGRPSQVVRLLFQWQMKNDK
jgi:hypothetical protein